MTDGATDRLAQVVTEQQFARTLLHGIVLAHPALRMALRSANVADARWWPLAVCAP
jgi:hypothetical protein